MKKKMTDLPRSKFAEFAEKKQVVVSFEDAGPGDKVNSVYLDKIAAAPDYDWLTIIKCKQKNFEAVAERFGDRFRRVSLFHCQRIADLGPMEKFSNLEAFDGNWNQITDAFWDFSRTPRVRALRFDGFAKIGDLSPLAAVAGLAELSLTMGINNNKSVLDSLKPLKALTELWDLEVRADRIADGDITPIAELPALRRLGLPTNIFDMASYIWLRAKILGRVECAIFDKSEDSVTISILKENGETKSSQHVYPIILGQGQRAGKKYASAFAQMTRWFAENPTALPADYA